MIGVRAILQARMGSTRLPGKIMLDLSGRPILAWVIQRAQAIPGVEQVIVATTCQQQDRPVMDLAAAQGARAFAGSETDVLDRYYQAAKQFGASVIVRVTGDCPLLDPGVSGSVLKRFLEGNADYVSNTNPPTFPDGLDTEVFSFRALERAWREAERVSEREHVTPYIWKHPEKFRLENVANAIDLSDHRWTVDEACDLKFVRAIYARLNRDGESSFVLADVLDLLAREPHLSKLNRGIQRNEGYEVSLQNEKQAG